MMCTEDLTMVPDLRLGEYIEFLCDRQGISLHKLSVLSGVSYSTLYSTVKRKSNKIEADTLPKILAALGYGIAILPLDEIPPEKNKYGFHECVHSRDETLGDALDKLNAEGIKKAVERVLELTEIPRYQRKTEDTETKPEGE